MPKKIRVIQYGLGPLGQKITHFLLERKQLQIVGAVDIDPAKVGMDLGELSGVKKKLGVTVSNNADAVIRGSRPDVVVLTTVSDMKRIAPQIAGILKHKVNVVSTCEELSYPFLTAPAVAGKIDALARKRGVAVLGTGVNPGFLMDYLPLSLTAVCKDVKTVTVWRIQDATPRRIPFQKKIGAGLTVPQFNRKKKEGTLRHVGLTESMHMIASGFGWKLDKTMDLIQPVIATRRVKSKAITAERGMCRGVYQIGRGFMKGREVLTLHFRAALGEKNPHERTLINGKPRIDMMIKGGVHGDIATCAITTNAVFAIMKANPGLRNMADMPAVSFVRAD
ncbi:MAG: dihydrodipicolinate reductase [Kiritimatiellae bacterium]|nr:dihydrodipicolinate reductase [Kiritimatiellia bacterium]